MKDFFMSNEFLWFSFAIVNFVMITLSYKLFGKNGLYAWIAAGTVIANIQVTKSVNIFGFAATLGNIMYGTLFLATDALGEKYSKKDAFKGVMIGFFILLSTTIIMQIALAFTPNSEDFAHDSLDTIFGLMPRIAFASILAYLISQFLDVTLFDKIKKAFPDDKYLIVRNNGSTLISQLVDTAIFVPIAFLGVYDNSIVLDIFITTYIIKLIVAFFDTPFVYLIKRIKPLELFQDKKTTAD